MFYITRHLSIAIIPTPTASKFSSFPSTGALLQRFLDRAALEAHDSPSPLFSHPCTAPIHAFICIRPIHCLLFKHHPNTKSHLLPERFSDYVADGKKCLICLQFVLSMLCIACAVKKRNWGVKTCLHLAPSWVMGQMSSSKAKERLRLS